MRSYFISGCKKSFCVIFLLYIFSFKGKTQCLTKENISDSISVIDNNRTLAASKKLERFYALKNTIDKCNGKHDSVYANSSSKNRILRSAC